ncbi:MAG: hypothetical protein HS130_07560 [Deltaproteobacteria bacterium]|nr:hypothetical protein [Deltaproteobacteria bacterium]MCL4873131.1 hypothetical protein [bacterium]
MAIEDLLQQPPWEFHSLRTQPDPPYDPVFTVYQDYFTWTDLFAGPSYDHGYYGPNAEALVVRDMSEFDNPNFFWGNFTHDFYFKINEFEGGGEVGTHRLQFYELGTTPIWDEDWEVYWQQASLYAEFTRETESAPLKVKFQLTYEIGPRDGGTPPDAQYTQEATIAIGTGYYYRIQRTSEGTYGKAHLKIYSDAARTNLVTTLTLDFDRATDDFVLSRDGGGTPVFWALWNICNRAQRYSSGEGGYIDLHMPKAQSLSGTGGFILGGTADMIGEPASPSITGSGGFILGGSAAIKRGAVRQGQGGLILGGRAAFLSWVLDSAAAQSGQIDPAFWGWRAGGDSIAFWGWSGGISTAVPYGLITGIKPYFQTTITVPDY